MKETLGIYIGRFQPFHNGHEKVVKAMLEENSQNVIIIGSLETDDNRNLFPSQWRQDIIMEMFPDTDVFLLADNPDDNKWVLSLKKLLDTYNSPEFVFYCGDRENDYAINVIEKYGDLLGNFTVREIPRTELPLTATEIRETIYTKGVDSIKEKVSPNVYKKIKAM